MVKTEDTKDLVVLEQQTAIEAFHDDDALEKLYADIKSAVDKMLPAGADMSKKKDRDVIRSLAAKIPKVKTKIDDWRKELTESERLKIERINARGKVIRERLETLKDEIRQPLTDWENAEEERQNEIKDMIQSTRELGQISFGETSEQIQSRIDRMPTKDLEWYAEFKDEAEIVIEETYNRLVAAKTVAVNTEKEAVERAAEKAELDRLREESERNARQAEARQRIVDIKNAGNGVLYLNSDFLDTQPTLDWLLRLKIDSSFGELIDEAATAREEALLKIQKKREKEKAEEQAEADRLQSIADQQAEIDRQREELQAEADKKAAEERERIEATAREQVEAEQAEANAAAAKAQAEADEVRRKELAAAREENMQATIKDIAEALVGSTRATAPSQLLEAILAGKVRHVVAPDLMEV